MVLTCKLSYGADYCGITGHASLNHVGENFHNRLIESEVLNGPLIL